MNFNSKSPALRVILDQPRLFLEESFDSVLVRGEVVVNFSKDTYIDGFIDLCFEGIQTFYPWKDIAENRKLGQSIKTKLQVTQLSLLPPHASGLIPAGIQRFPFEFPIPSNLPHSIDIVDRLTIHYTVSASLKCSSKQNDGAHSSPSKLLDWATRSSGKRYFALQPMRIVRPMESIASHGTITDSESISSNSMHSPSTTSSLTDTAPGTPTQDQPWNRRHLDHYQSTFDEQHDLLAYSLSGRVVENFMHKSMENVQGVRYRIGVDRTAIVQGTNVGIELVIQPTFANCVIRSVKLNISETRNYAMIVPGEKTPLKSKDLIRMVLKWATGYTMDNNGLTAANCETDSAKFVHRHACDDTDLAHFVPPKPGSPRHKQFFQAAGSVQAHKTDRTAGPSTPSKNENMIDLKELNQAVNVGEYFGGRFVLPVPDCSSILHPGVNYESIQISHWMELVITVECNNRAFDIRLESPMRMLDCRLVAADDEQQTILPPPPSYQNSDTYIDNSQSTFWVQREPLTSASGWGSCVPCPCELRKMQKSTKKKSSLKVSPSHSFKPSVTHSLPTL